MNQNTQTKAEISLEQINKGGELLSTIKPASGLHSLAEIFTNRFFEIPDYQRSYSWEEKHVLDMKEDIIRMRDRDYRHFTGTIVASQNRDVTFDIVDGQQRLTTLIILLNEIYQLNPEEYGDLKGKFLERGEIGNERLVLTPNAETKAFFKDCILHKKDVKEKRVKAHDLMQNTSVIFQKWLKGLDKSELDLIKATVVDKLGFIFFAPEKTKETGIMFEVINNRGKKLSELEKIKNYFIYYSSLHGLETLRDEINAKWAVMQEYLNRADRVSNDDENRFLRNCFILYYDSDKKNRSEDVYPHIKERYENPKHDHEFVDEIRSFVELLVLAARNYACLVKQDIAEEVFRGQHELLQIIKYYRCHFTNASTLPIYLAIMCVDSSMETKAHLLNMLEKLNFRVYLLPVHKRADTKQAALFQFAHEYYWDQEWISQKDEPIETWFLGNIVEGDIHDWLYHEMKDFTKHMCSEKQFLHALTLDLDEPFDFYYWRGLRYILGRYEEDLQRKNRKQYWDVEEILRRNEIGSEVTNYALTLEHIWAQNNLADSFPANYHDKRRLGNFVLLGGHDNPSISDTSIEAKIDSIINISHIANRDALRLASVVDLKNKLDKAHEVVNTFRSYKNSYYFRDIARVLCDLRETEIIQFAWKTWKVEGEGSLKLARIDTLQAERERKNEVYYLKDQ